jgi:predicted O-methyltransferase YrrM
LRVEQQNIPKLPQRVLGLRPLSLQSNFKYKEYWRKTGLKKHFGQILIDLVKDQNPQNFLEIGVFTGVTARNICELLSLINNGKFYYLGIDLFEDFENVIRNEVVPEFLIKKQNFSNPLKSLVYNFILKEKLNSLKSVSSFLKKFQDNIDLKKGNSLNILPQIDIKKFDMIFVDGGHSYETVKFELGILLKNINDNCLVICDDYIHAEAKGVKKAIDESVGENLYNFKVVANRFACLTKK